MKDKKYYIVIDKDRHRDDIITLYEEKENAIEEAKELTSKWKKKGYDMDVDGETDNGFVYSSWNECGYDVTVREIETGEEE